MTCFAVASWIVSFHRGTSFAEFLTAPFHGGIKKKTSENLSIDSHYFWSYGKREVKGRENKTKRAHDDVPLLWALGPVS